MDRDTRSQSKCDSDKSSSICYKRERSSNSLSNSTHSLEKVQNHSLNNGRKRRRVSCDSENDNDDDILKLDPIENCVSPYSNSSINSSCNNQNQNNYSHNNFNNNHNNFNNSHSNNHKNNNNSYKNNNNFNNNYKNNNNNNNKNNNNNRNNLYNNNNNQNNNWYQKNQRFNNGNNKNNNNRPFNPLQQRINDLQERLNQKELQLRESKIVVMNRESDITELKIQHERNLLELEKNHCRKIKDMQLKEIDLIEIQKDETMKLKLTLENKREIITKLRKDLEASQNDLTVTRAILETTNNRNVELTNRIAELIETKKKTMNSKRIQTDAETQVDILENGTEPKKFHMSPPQSTIVHSTTKPDYLPYTQNSYSRTFDFKEYNLADKFNRYDSSDSGVSLAKSESFQSQVSVENNHRYDNDLFDASKLHFQSSNLIHKDKQNELLKLIYKKSSKNSVKQNLTINIDGTKSDDYVMVDYIESPDEMPGKVSMENQSDLNGSRDNLEKSRDYFVDILKDSRDHTVGIPVSKSIDHVESLNYKENSIDLINGSYKNFNNARIFSNRLKDGYENSSEDLGQNLIKFGEILEESKQKVNKSRDSSPENSLDLKFNGENSTNKVSRKEVIKSTDILNDFKEILGKSQQSYSDSQENFLKFPTKSTELFTKSQHNTNEIDQNIKFCHEISNNNDENSTGFESISRSFEETSKILLQKFSLSKEDIELEIDPIRNRSISTPKDIFKSPAKSYELSPKIHNIPPDSRDSRRSSSDLSKDLSGSTDNLSITSELQDFLNLSESEQVEEPQKTTPISVEDFRELARKFKEKFKQNKIQKAARELLHISIVPCYSNDIEKTSESVADRNESINKSNRFSDEKKLLNNQNNKIASENQQRSMSTDDYKTTNKTDIKIDKNNQKLENDLKNNRGKAASVLLSSDSIKLEKDKDVSDNETDIDEYCDSIVRRLIKRESDDESDDEISSISSQCTTSNHGADDDVRKCENISADKIQPDNSVVDNNLRVSENVGAEKITSICTTDKKSELEKQSESHCANDIPEKSTECEKNSDKCQNSVRADLSDLEETIKILEGSSENLATRQDGLIIDNQEISFLAKNNLQKYADNLVEPYKISENLSKLSENSTVILENNLEQISNELQNPGRDVQNSNTIIENSSKSHQHFTNPEEGLSKNNQNLSKTSQNETSLTTISQNFAPVSVSPVQSSIKNFQSTIKEQSLTVLQQNSTPLTKNQPTFPKNARFIQNAKRIQKIEDFCPSYLHSFRDFLSERSFANNLTLKKVNNKIIETKLVENSKSILQKEPEAPLTTKIISKENELNVEIERNKWEQRQKEFQQKQQLSKIMKRRESILVDNFCSKKQKIETRSGNKNEEELKITDEKQKLAEQKMNGPKNPELENVKKNLVNLNDESLKIYQSRVVDEISLKDDQLSARSSNLNENVSQFPIDLKGSQNISNPNESNSKPEILNYQLVDIQTNATNNQIGSSGTQTNSGINHKIDGNGKKNIIYSTDVAENIQIKSFEKSTKTSEIHKNDIMHTNHNSTHVESSKSTVELITCRIINSVTHPDSQNIQNDSVMLNFDLNNKSDETGFGRLKHSQSDSAVNSPINLIKSREEFRSLTPEYRGSPSSMGQSPCDFGKSPVESFTKISANPTIKSSPSTHIKLPYKNDLRKHRQLPSEDEMGVCSQIVATTLKKSQQQREMSRSSEERMFQNGNFQGYSINEQFYGYRNERVDSGFKNERITNERIERNERFDRHNQNNNSTMPNFYANRFQPSNDINRRNSVHDSVHNRPNDRKFFDRSVSLISQDLRPKSPSKYARSNSYHEPQFKVNQKTPLTIPFRPIKEPSFINDNPNIQHNKSIIPSPSLSPPPLMIDENNFKRAQNKNEISQLVIAELTVFYELKKFESDNPKELFKSMARAITYHFYDKNPDIVPNKNVIKNYVMEVFYNFGTIRSEKDFLLSEDYDGDV